MPCNPRATSFLVVHRCCARWHLIITVPRASAFSHCRLNVFAIRWFVIRGHREKPTRYPLRRLISASCGVRLLLKVQDVINLRIPLDLYGMNYIGSSISWKEMPGSQTDTIYIEIIKLSSCSSGSPLTQAHWQSA